MRTLAFDGRMGASGDMICGALLAAGADPAALEPVESTLPVRYAIESVEKNGIAATSVDVLLVDDADRELHDGGHDDGRDHQSHDDDPTHGGDRTHGHAEGGRPLRSYPEVIEIVERMDLDSAVERRAIRTFELLGEAEAAVHGTALDETHFHEVGADDAIADIVGAALLFDALDLEHVVTTPLATGGGEITMSHGRYPVPTPAVVELAERADWSLRGGPTEHELLTPTGAAILANYADGVETLPTLGVEGSGYGAGGYDFPERPNVLRALVGRSEGGLVRDDIRVLETTLDDATPEVLGGLQESLAEVGARDITVSPTTMKKSRPGHVVRVVVKPEDADRVARRVAEETGTLGVRDRGVRHRWVAERRIEPVELTIDGETYAVDVKIAGDAEGSVYDVSAEYDDAALVARESDHPVRAIMRQAEATLRDEQ